MATVFIYTQFSSTAAHQPQEWECGHGASGDSSKELFASYKSELTRQICDLAVANDDIFDSIEVGGEAVEYCLPINP